MFESVQRFMIFSNLKQLNAQRDCNTSQLIFYAENGTPAELLNFSVNEWNFGTIAKKDEWIWEKPR